MLDKGRNLPYLSIVKESSLKNNLLFYYILFSISMQKMFLTKSQRWVYPYTRLRADLLPYMKHILSDFANFSLSISIKKILIKKNEVISP